MPYIPEKDRQKDSIDNPGKLNFILTSIINDYLKEKGLSYTTINTIVAELENLMGWSFGEADAHLRKRLHEAKKRYIGDVLNWDKEKIAQAHGAIRCCQLEFYRRIAVPYENSKLSENGDVY